MQSYCQNKRISSDLLSFISTSTSRSDRSAQAKPPSAMSSDSVSTSTELSPELRVGVLHGYNSVSCSLVVTNCSSDLLCTLQVRPKAVNKVCGQNMSVCAFYKNWNLACFLSQSIAPYLLINCMWCLQKVLRDSDKEEPQLLPNEMVHNMGRFSDYNHSCK